MIETSIPDISVDELMEKIRAEVKQRKELGRKPSGSIPPENSGIPPSLYEKINLPVVSSIPDPEKFEIKDHYHINDFLKFRDRNFVMVAYRGILRRRPDSGGVDHFLGNLRSGKMTKAEILGRLRYAPEGRTKKTKVKGLFWNSLIQSSFGIPVLGYFPRLMFGIGNLPLILRNMRVFEEYASTQLESHRNDLGMIQPKIEQVIEAFGHLDTILTGKADRNELGLLKDEIGVSLEVKADRNELGLLKDEIGVSLEVKADRNELGLLKDEIGVSLEVKADRNELGLLKDEIGASLEVKADRNELGLLKDEIGVSLEVKADRNELGLLKDEIGASLENKANTEQIREILRQTRDHKLNILDQQRRLKLLLEEARKRLPEPFSREQLETLVSEEDHLHDAMYVSFEDQFRGTRGDIKKRLGVYLPYMEKAGAGSTEAPILDAGCGRGEWLELCKDNNLEACGVDINRVMVSQCGEAGFDVVESDVITFLRDQKTNSIGAITGFHIIEHLPLNLLIAFIDEAYRVVKPGGVVIFETPNPENVLVGSCNFYFDPTHRNPLPPLISQFLLESRGLSQIEVKRLHPYDEDFQIADENTETSRRLNEHFYGPQDYAVIGFKIQ